jgi:hypothetical protein
LTERERDSEEGEERGAGFRVSGFRVQGVGCRVQGPEFGVEGLGFRDTLGFRVQGSGFRV